VVCIRGSGGSDILFLLAPSVRAARAGSFLFLLSMLSCGIVFCRAAKGGERVWS